VSKNVDDPSKEKLIGISPSSRIGSIGTVTFRDTTIPCGPEKERVAAIILLKYLIDAMLPGGTFDKDKNIGICDVEFRAIEKG
jgi:hypothetical protein